MSISSLLSIARTGLLAHQAAMDVIANNVANAETEGYSRQRVALGPVAPNVLGRLVLGGGVQISGIERTRDAVLDAAARSTSTSASGFALRHDALTRVEQVVNEPSETGISAALDRFWDAWSDLALSPSGQTERAVLRQRGMQLANTLNSALDGLADARRIATEQLDSSLRTLSATAQRIAELNRGIAASEAAGGSANDLRDARDRLIDEAARLAPVTVREAPDGMMTVAIGGIPIVDGTNAAALERQTISGRIAIATASGIVPVLATDGEIGAQLRVLDGDLTDLEAQLTLLGDTLVDAVNTIHSQGWTSSATGIDFFDAASWVGTGRLSLTAQVLASPAAIAAGTTLDATGDNGLALQMAALRTGTHAALGGRSLGNYWREAATTVGVAVAAAEDDASVAATLAGNAETRRQSVSGVSTDEELSHLIRVQQAYSAAARLVRVADDVARSLLEAF